MPDGAKTLLVILLIPFLCGLGHDVYINYLSTDQKIKDIKALRIDPEKFLVSDLGWVWNHYSPDSMQSVRDMMEPEEFQKNLDPILRLPTMVVGLIPWAIATIYMAFSALFGFWPCSESVISFTRKRKRNEDFAVYKHSKAKTIKYKKK